MARQQDLEALPPCFPSDQRGQLIGGIGVERAIGRKLQGRVFGRAHIGHRHTGLAGQLLDGFRVLVQMVEIGGRTGALRPPVDGEGALELVTGVAPDQARVDATARHDGDGNVGHELTLNGGTDDLAGHLERDTVVQRRVDGFGHEITERDVRGFARGPAQGGARSDRADVAVRRSRLGHPHECQELGQGCDIVRRRTTEHGAQRRDLRCEGQSAGCGGPEERLHSEWVTREDQPMLPEVGQGQRVDAVESLKPRDSVFLVQMEDDFSVGVGRELVAERLELPTEVLVVVDLPVEDEVQFARGIGERLVSRLGEVDDRQSGMPEPQRRVAQTQADVVQAVGAAMLYQHRVDVVGRTQRADDAAHG